MLSSIRKCMPSVCSTWCLQILITERHLNEWTFEKFAIFYPSRYFPRFFLGGLVNTWSPINCCICVMFYFCPRPYGMAAVGRCLSDHSSACLCDNYKLCNTFGLISQNSFVLVTLDYERTLTKDHIMHYIINVYHPRKRGVNAFTLCVCLFVCVFITMFVRSI